MKMIKEEKVVIQKASIEDNENEGLMALLGQKVILFCANYIYSGKLIGVNRSCIKLEDAHIVFETGAFTDSKYKDAQKIAAEHYIQTSAIESFGVGK